MCSDTLKSPVCGPIAPEDVLHGQPIMQPAECTACRSTLQSGDPVCLYAYRLVHARTWDLTRIYCPDCRRTRVRTPTLGAVEIVADAVLATQSRPDQQRHSLCVVDLSVTDYSGPADIELGNGDTLAERLAAIDLDADT